jgi:hypothetical protein
MKKINLVIITLIAALLLAGCGDASGKLSDGNSVIFQVGNTKLTKNEFYETMRDHDNGDYIVKDLAKLLVNKEIETTDAITKEANDVFDEVIGEYDNDLAKALQTLGYDSEEDLRSDILDSVKSDYLVDKYLDDNWSALTAKYLPAKIRVLTFTTQENETEPFRARADKAYAELKSGVSFDEVAKKYMPEGSGAASLAAEALFTTDTAKYDKAVVEYMKTVVTPGLSEVFYNEAKTSCYIVYVTNNNISQLKSDFSNYLKNSDAITEELYGFYLQKYGFRVYDINIYNILKTNYPNYLVQDKEK